MLDCCSRTCLSSILGDEMQPSDSETKFELPSETTSFSYEVANPSDIKPSFRREAKRVPAGCYTNHASKESPTSGILSEDYNIIA